MGARDEKTQEAACVNHKPSLLGVKYRGRSIASLTFSYRLQISMYKKKNFCYSGTQIPVLEVSWSTWSWVLYWNNWASCSLSALLASLSAHHVSSHGTENSQSSAVCTFCLQTLASLQSTCSSPIWKISAKRTWFFLRTVETLCHQSMTSSK